MIGERISRFFGGLGKFFNIIFWPVFGIFFISALISGASSSNDEVSRADGFTIEKYNVILDVKKDNKVDVTENITVNFEEDTKHGILKFVPQWLEYTGKDGKTIKRNSKVINLRAEGDEYSLDTVKKKKRIKIGNIDKYVDVGLKTYVIKYTYDMGKDPYKGFDEFIFHTFGDYWGTEIKNASVEINMPKPILGRNINFYKDKYRRKKITNLVDYTIKGNTLYANYNREKDYETQLEEYCNIEYHVDENGNCDSETYFEYAGLKKSMTVDIELPEGYFEGGSWNYGFGSVFIALIIVLLTIWTIIKWYKYGKDYAKKAQTVEFYPPDNLNSAEIGYIYNNKQLTKKLTISLIVQLASKGYIKIDELSDKKKNIQITNLVMRKPVAPTSLEKLAPKRVIQVKKLRDIDDNLIPSERSMMKFLFKNGDVKDLDSNMKKFLKVKDKLVNNGYIQIISDNEAEVNAAIKEKQGDYNKSIEKYNIDMKTYDDAIAKLPALSKLETIVYDILFEYEDVIIISEHKTLYKAFNDVGSEINTGLKNKIHDDVYSVTVGSIIRNVIILILSIISYCFVEDLDPNWSIVYFISFLCIFVNLFFIFIMKRKTEYGELITARVKGFRHFLETAEKDKLEALVAENPSYFYNILPYTYAMNISKKWIKKFEDIPMPKMDMGTFDYSDSSSYASIANDISYPTGTGSSGSSSGSGCSSCGGGCSSCGGGCSSCGGGGSW